LPTFTDEIFHIDQAVKQNPDIYLLRDHKNEPIHGRFYEPELGKTRVDDKTTYRIEKVLKKDRKNHRLLVKFIGYPDYHWISNTDIV